MKPMTLLSLIAGAVLLNSAAHAQQQAEPVTQVIVGERVYRFSEQPRLLNAYLAAELEPSAYWPSSRVVTAAQTQKLAERRSQVLERLQQLASVATAEGEEALAADAQAYAEQLQSWPLIGAEWIGRPGGIVADRHDIGMAGEAEVGRAVAEPGVEVVDIVLGGLGERQPVTGEAEPGQRLLENAERAAVGRRHAGAGDQRAGERDRVDGVGHVRSSSLSDVLARVPASTCLTMTAQ